MTAVNPECVNWSRGNSFTYIQTLASHNDMRDAYANPPGHIHSLFPTLTAGAFTAVYDGQHDRLALSAFTLQAEESDWVVRVQTVTTALTN